ncbi:MAG: alpha/beta hydrolase [Gammaproteobacteria bacterium]|nr:alpha/beta hydrolase [Gammaproteobacteria bacterium]
MVTSALKPVAHLLLIGGLIYLVLLLYVYLNQSNMIYMPDVPSRQVGTSPQAIGLSYEDVELVTKDGIKLQAWYLPATQARGTLLFLHGNAGNISHRLDSLQLFHNLGLNTLIFDYRGYGNSAGKPDEAGIYQDAETAWQYLTEVRGIPPGEILLFGRSFGGAVAAYLAELHPALGLILESTFTSVPDMAAALYPWLPVRSLTKAHYDTRSRLASIEIPVLVIHSPDDEIIPYDHGRTLFELAGEPKRFLQLQGDHNYGFMKSLEAYRAGWDEFIEACNRYSNRSRPSPEDVDREGKVSTPIDLAPIDRGRVESEPIDSGAIYSR